MFKRKVLSILILSVVVSVTSLVASQNNYQYQEKANHSVENALYYLWHEGDIKKTEKEFFKGITIQGRLDLSEKYFAIAVDAVPNWNNYKFCLASVQILQGKVDQAVKTYDNILISEPENFNATILDATYSKYCNLSSKYTNLINRLQKTYPKKTTHYIKTISNIERNFKLQLNSLVANLTFPNNSSTAIVTLGYALSKNGVMQPTLIERLKKTLSAANKYKSSLIIVSGGVAQQGVCESYLMKKWLVKNGISANRIIIEDRSKDTVGNALYTTQILKENKSIKNIILITSASHIRRAISVFEEVAAKNSCDLSYENLDYMDFSSEKQSVKVSRNEILATVRDVFRASGIWAYPGIQR
jgi:uncharacterized SAM-binding protein YcdF (DUF218 family)